MVKSALAYGMSLSWLPAMLPELDNPVPKFLLYSLTKMFPLGRSSGFSLIIELHRTIYSSGLFSSNIISSLKTSSQYPGLSTLWQKYTYCTYSDIFPLIYRTNYFS